MPEQVLNPLTESMKRAQQKAVELRERSNWAKRQTELEERVKALEDALSTLVKEPPKKKV